MAGVDPKVRLSLLFDWRARLGTAFHSLLVPGKSKMDSSLSEHAHLSFASHGEDVVAIGILKRHGLWREKGCYVDIGAFHPFCASNTAVLHRLGWGGINVEPNPAMADLLRTARPEDFTLQAAVGGSRRVAELHFFYDWASSNTLVESFANEVSSSQNVEISARIPVQVFPLRELLCERMPAGERIDFLTVDVEGMDLEVLASNDWGLFSPELVAVEDLSLDLAKVHCSDIYRFMADHDYRLVAHTAITSFYLRK